MDDTARPHPVISRRVALSGAAAVGATGVLALTGCGSDSGAAPATTSQSSGTSRTAGGTSSAPGTAGPAGTGGPAGAPLVATADVPVGGATVVTADGVGIVVAQPSAGQFVAHSARCTHRGCTVGVDKGLALLCPCHGSRYDAATGEVTRGPAPRALASVKVTVADGTVRLG